MHVNVINNFIEENSCQMCVFIFLKFVLCENYFCVCTNLSLIAMTKNDD